MASPESSLSPRLSDAQVTTLSTRVARPVRRDGDAVKFKKHQLTLGDLRAILAAADAAGINENAEVVGRSGFDVVVVL